MLPVCQGISCPLVRIERDQRPCLPMRSNLKAELLALASGDPDGRKVHVPALAATTAGAESVATPAGAGS